MSKNYDDLIKVVNGIGIVPVIVLNDPAKAVPLAKALIAGGIPCIEVTFRTAAAEASIKAINAEVPEMLLGAGTVITIEQAEKAIAAGAKFIVSPGLDENIVKWCQERDVPVFPGVCTASEVQKAVSLGLNILKFFPAEASGGVNMIKNLCGPFPQVKFMTTGGISPANLAEYAACPFVTAVGGSWMAKADLIEKEDWATITAMCREAVCAMNGFQFIHFGINTPSAEDASKAADCLSIFGMQKKVGNSSTFMNAEIEVMHSMFKGECGHIGFKCYNVERSINYLSNYGFTVDEETVKTDAKGKIKVAYLKQQVAGFAIHLVKA
ncbi:MAG: bifunctional 4-hydroxy-2-oxoglutarate aldolase/2-dehydro-3-deoxy-phosphogluconate aldolase [Sphaerochaetaceae bacterium]|nr:bifunctional 4-hydroxy-2-oxoglutarate aldolase/2-dehydro-3-deoxy-phosphogluconate aldolase [Sphaerochaetaceae bacterium]